MTTAKQIARIERLAGIDRHAAQIEADIAMRSASSTQVLNKIKAACRVLGLVDVVQYI